MTGIDTEHRCGLILMLILTRSSPASHLMPGAAILFIPRN